MSKKKLFIGFLTAGDPYAGKIEDYVLAMERAGADVVEIGIPFSDPTAEEVVVQEANIRALNAGMTTDGVFEIVGKIRKENNIPIVLRSYLNPVFRYGYEAFFKKCETLKVNGIVIPDLPYEEKNEVESVAKQFGVDVITMIATTSKQRIQMLAKEATGFIYVVPAAEEDIDFIVDSVQDVTDTPVAVGLEAVRNH